MARSRRRPAALRGPGWRRSSARWRARPAWWSRSPPPGVLVQKVGNASLRFQRVWDAAEEDARLLDLVDFNFQPVGLGGGEQVERRAVVLVAIDVKGRA